MKWLNISFLKSHTFPQILSSMWGIHNLLKGKLSRKQTFILFVFLRTILLNNILKLIDHLHATRWTPPVYWQTNNSNGLVMVIRNYHWLNSASRVLILTCSAQLVQIGERKQTHTVWPWPLTYNPRLAKVKVDPHAKKQGQRSNGSNRRVPTDKWTDTHTHTRMLPNVLPPLLHGR